MMMMMMNPTYILRSLIIVFYTPLRSARRFVEAELYVREYYGEEYESDDSDTCEEIEGFSDCDTTGRSKELVEPGRLQVHMYHLYT